MRELLRPTNPYGSDAILPGDPQVALELAQVVIDGPLMANHARGLWGYSGPERSRPDRLISIQSTGYGGQSAAAVVHQLAGLGVRRAIRLGTCIALDSSLAAGDALLVAAAVGPGGARHIGSAGLGRMLADAYSGELRTGVVASLDTADAAKRSAPEAIAADGSTAGLLGGAAEAEVEAAALLTVIESGAAQLDDERAREALIELGTTATSALAGQPVYVGGVKRP